MRLYHLLVNITVLLAMEYLESVVLIAIWWK